MSSLVETLIVSLVAYRLWRLIGQDDISDMLRLRIRQWKPAALHMVECGWCLGSWVSLAVAFSAWGVGWVDSPPLLVGFASAVVVGVLSERLT